MARQRTAKNGQAWARLLPTANRSAGGHLFYVQHIDGTLPAQPPTIHTGHWTLLAAETVEALKAHPKFSAIIEFASTPNPPAEETE